MAENPTSSALEQFVLLAKSAKGQGAVELVKQAIEAPGVFVFGELLQMPNIQELETSHPQYYDLLQLFCYGSYKEFSGHREKLPALSELMMEKLRLLTLVSLATRNKSIPYSLILEELGLKNLRALEDLVISAIYAGVITGRLEQRRQTLEIHAAVSRDVKPQQVDEIARVLETWCGTCERMLTTLAEQMEMANSRREEARALTKKTDDEVANLKKTLKATRDVDGDDAGMADSAAIGLEKLSKKGGKSKGLRGSAKSTK